MISIALRLSGLVALAGCCCLMMVCVEATVDAEQEYQRLFAHKGKPGQPPETLRDLQNLANLLRDKQDETSKERLAEIEKLVKFNDITKCDTEIGDKLDSCIDNYDFPGRQMPTIRGYLKDCRDKLFSRCNMLLDIKMRATLKSLDAKPRYIQILRFRKFIAANTYDLPYLTFAYEIKSQLVNYIAKEYDERRLDPKMKREEFDEKFNRTLKQVCEDIENDTKFTDDYSIFFNSKRVCKQMDSRLKDMYRMRVVCRRIRMDPEGVSKFLYEKLTN